MHKSEDEEIKASVKCLRAAVAKIQSLGISATPENYSIWYDYYSGRKPSLTAMVDKRLENGGVFNKEFSRRVYSQFFLTDPERELSEVRSAIRNLIDALVKELSEIDANMSCYERTLEECNEGLSKDPEVETLSAIVHRLIEETQKCRNVNKQSLGTVNKLNQEISNMREALQEMSEAALEDALTGIPNRRAFDVKLKEMIASARTENEPLCLILLDIDLFKRVNDQHGHIVGDRVLRFVAEMIKRSIKGGDFVARFGGEEFAVILPKTEFDGGFTVAQAILKNVASTKLKVNKGGESVGSITLSAGVSLLNSNDDLESILERADDHLYTAKNSGRNSVKGDL